MRLYSKLPDTVLVTLLKQDDQLAYKEIYDRYKTLLHTHVYKWLNNREEAKDIIHDLFLALWVKRDVLSFKGPLSTYLYAAVRNRVFDLFSHQKSKSDYIHLIKSSIKDADCITDHLVRERMLAQIIENEINNFPPKMKAVFNLSRKNQLSHREIADQLNLSEQTVRKHIQHALKILKTKLYIATIIFTLFHR